MVICEEGFRHKQQQSGFQSWQKPSENKIIQKSLFIVGLLSKTPKLLVLNFIVLSLHFLCLSLYILQHSIMKGCINKYILYNVNLLYEHIVWCMYCIYMYTELRQR